MHAKLRSYNAVTSALRVAVTNEMASSDVARNLRMTAAQLQTRPKALKSYSETRARLRFFAQHETTPQRLS